MPLEILVPRRLYRQIADQLRQLIDDGWSLLIFPEGGRSPDGWGQPFRGGAAFLSVRREFVGEAERVKEIFKSAATDMGRDRYFQGSGLVDLMRAIQSV